MLHLHREIKKMEGDKAEMRSDQKHTTEDRKHRHRKPKQATYTVPANVTRQKTRKRKARKDVLKAKRPPKHNHKSKLSTMRARAIRRKNRGAKTKLKA